MFASYPGSGEEPGYEAKLENVGMACQQVLGKDDTYQGVQNSISMYTLRMKNLTKT